MDSAAFLAHQNVLQFVLGEERIVNGKDGTARIPEDDVNALIGQSFDHHFRTGHHCARHRLVLPSPYLAKPNCTVRSIALHHPTATRQKSKPQRS